MLTEPKQLLLLSRSELQLISAPHSDSLPLPKTHSGIPQTDTVLSWRRRFTHKHAYREAMLVLQGEVLQGLNGSVYHGRPGTLFLYDAGDWHDQGFPQSAPDSDQMWMFFAPDFIACYGIELRAGRYTTDFRCSCKSMNLIRRLHNAWNVLNKSCQDQVRRQLALAQLQAAFKLLFAEVVIDAQQKEQGGQITNAGEEAIKEVMNLLEQTAGKAPEVVTLARMAGFSRSHFLRLFQKHAGMTVKEFIHQVRQQNYHKLIQENTPMKVIAAELGFKSSSALAHWRRKYVK